MRGRAGWRRPRRARAYRASRGRAPHGPARFHRRAGPCRVSRSRAAFTRAAPGMAMRWHGACRRTDCQVRSQAGGRAGRLNDRQVQHQPRRRAQRQAKNRQIKTDRQTKTDRQKTDRQEQGRGRFRPRPDTWHGGLGPRSDPRDQISLPMATAVSDIRFEKPHSLSYQVRMRHMVPSMTLVWSVWKIDECGSWLKSIETLGLSV